MDEIYICNIKELDIPLGINLKGVVTGLDIVYELTDESLYQFNMSKFDTLSIHTSITSSSLIKRTLGLKESKRNLSFVDNNNLADKNLKLLDFKNLKVNKSHSVKFVIKNLSGIPTNFSFESKNFKPGIEKDLNYNIRKNSNILDNSLIKQSTVNTNPVHTANSQNNIFINPSSSNMNKDTNNNYAPNITANNVIVQNEMNITTKNNLNNITLHRKNFLNGYATKTRKMNIGHSLLSDWHENINFTSVKGQEFTKMRHYEKDSVLYLSSKKGVAIVIEPKQGKLDPHSEHLITVKIYNECVGDFEDELIANVKGLPERRFPINLKIRGNPLQLAPFQPGIDYSESTPVLKMGYIITNVNSINKTFKVINTGTNLISLDWKIFNYEEVLNPKDDIFKIRITQSKNKESFSLIFNSIEPKESENFDYFKISPKNVLIQPKGMQDLSVNFNTDISGLKSALLVAYPKFLDDSKIVNVRLSELALKVDAYGVKPDLVVDKKVKSFI